MILQKLVAAFPMLMLFAVQGAWAQESQCASIKNAAARLACFDKGAKAAEESGTGSIEGTITWQYNKFVGTRGDTGAKVILLKAPLEETFGKLTESNKSLLAVGILSDKPGIAYSAEVDGFGKFRKEGIPAGEYFALVISNNTRPGPDDVYAKHCADKLAPFVNDLKFFDKVYCRTIEVTSNQSTYLTRDFGNTYF